MAEVDVTTRGRMSQQPEDVTSHSTPTCALHAVLLALFQLEESPADMAQELVSEVSQGRAWSKVVRVPGELAGRELWPVAMTAVPPGSAVLLSQEGEGCQCSTSR